MGRYGKHEDTWYGQEGRLARRLVAMTIRCNEVGWHAVRQKEVSWYMRVHGTVRKHEYAWYGQEWMYVK